MRTALLHEAAGQRTFVVILETGDEVVKSLSDFATEERISAAQISAIGALSDVELKYFDWQTKKYRSIPVHEQVEVASLLGDVALSPDGKPALHLHIVVGKADGAAMAGHLGQAHVRPTLEVIVTESPAHLRKRYDPASGLVLIEPRLTEKNR
jgi:predicted DNA-binding protein with PD1-like motif